MRDYAKVKHQFWHGDTGRRIKRHGAETTLLAMYLITSPNSNMLGLYWIPIGYMESDTGVPMKGLRKGLSNLLNEGFASYDEDSQFVWVFEMATHQIELPLKEKDKRVIGARKQYALIADNPYLEPFYDKYSKLLHLDKKRVYARGFQGASKPESSEQGADIKPFLSGAEEFIGGKAA